jgi:ElaB/YqjD/DUF883 family membrane-anchored ribosome-binding protein
MTTSKPRTPRQPKQPKPPKSTKLPEQLEQPEPPEPTEPDEFEFFDEEDDEFVSEQVEPSPIAQANLLTFTQPKSPGIMPGMNPAAVKRQQSQEQIRERRRRALGESLLALALEEQDPDFKNKVYEIIVHTGMDVNDPALLLMIATGRLETLLEESPKELSALFDQWAEVTHSQITNYREGLEHYERAAVKGQQKAIARAAEKLVQKVAIEQFVKSINAMSIGIGAGVVLLAIGAGFLAGNMWASARADNVTYAPGKPRQLSLTEANALQWATSDEGQFAQDLMKWNADLLTPSAGKLPCEMEAAQLGVTLEVEGRKASSGFCTLWVAPATQRGLAR